MTEGLHKKHYEAIARIMSNFKAHLRKAYGVKAFKIELVEEALAFYFKTQDKKFNRIKFLKLCGVEE